MNITQQLVDELGKQIFKKRYQVGDKLPSEAEISEKFGVSRTATREAVKMLTAKGLISSRPRQGIKVNEQKHWNFFDSDVLSWILEGQHDLFMLRHFLQLRQAIEAQAAFLAAQYAKPEDLLLIQQALSRMLAAEQGKDDSHEADMEFHQAVLNATNNPFFIQLKNFIKTALKANLRFTQRMQAVTTAEYQAHLDLFNAIKTGQAQQAFDAANETQQATLSIVDREISKQQAA